MPNGANVVVVGGGIIGCSCAYALARGGASVTLLEADQLAAGASGRNHGLLLSPLDPDLLPMAAASVSVYEEIQDGAPLPFGLDRGPVGFLVVAGDVEAERATGTYEAKVAAGCGVASEHLDRAAVRRLEPNLASDIAEGWLLDDGRRLDPAALTVSLGLLAAELGALVRTGEAARGLLAVGDRIRGVLTDRGRVEADTVVLAAGPWTAPLLRRVGAGLPITGGRGWLVHLAPAEPPIARLVGRAGWHVPPSPEPSVPWTAADLAEGFPRGALGTLLHPNSDGTLLVGGSRQPVVTHEPEDPSVPRRLVEEAIRLVPSLGGAAVLGSWWGIRPSTPDGRPFVGQVREGLIVAAGHGSLGVILGGGTGLLVASMILGDEAPFATAAFSPHR